MRLVFLVLFILIGPAHAGEVLKGEDIRALFSGNTISGAYTDGIRFSEFHAADGRALGDNGHALNVDACWNVEADQVCYHYGQPKDRRSYCFTVARRGEGALPQNQSSKDQAGKAPAGQFELRVATNGRLNALADIEPGNPNQHSDGGRRWSCDDLLAQTPDQGETRRWAQVQIPTVTMRHDDPAFQSGKGLK